MTEKNLILEELRATNGNISKVARSLGLDYFALKSRFGNLHTPAPFKPNLGPEPADIRVLGKSGMEHFVIAIKRAGFGWPSKYDDVILEARRKFDAGTHEMVQSSNRGWVVQYLIPRLVPTSPRRFFANMQVITSE